MKTMYRPGRPFRAKFNIGMVTMFSHDTYANSVIGPLELNL